MVDKRSASLVEVQEGEQAAGAGERIRLQVDADVPLQKGLQHVHVRAGQVVVAGEATPIKANARNEESANKGVN